MAIQVGSLVKLKAGVFSELADRVCKVVGRSRSQSYDWRVAAVEPTASDHDFVPFKENELEELQHSCN